MSQRRADQRKGLAVMTLLFAAVVLLSLGFPSRARLFPLLIGLAGGVLAILEAWSSARTDPEVPDTEHVPLTGAFIAILPYLAWLLAFFALAALMGFVTAAGAFVGAFLRREAGASWLSALLGGVATVAFLVVVGSLFGLYWPVSAFDPLRAVGLL